MAKNTCPCGVCDPVNAARAPGVFVPKWTKDEKAERAAATAARTQGIKEGVAEVFLRSAFMQDGSRRPVEKA